jgi:hypothetical protein
MTRNSSAKKKGNKESEEKIKCSKGDVDLSISLDAMLTMLSNDDPNTKR